jgi:hypothetical protein
VTSPLAPPCHPKNKAAAAGWLEAEHFLGSFKPVGRSLRHIIREDGQPVAVVQWAACAYHLKDPPPSSPAASKPAPATCESTVLTGATVSADGMYTNAENARIIVQDKGGDYLLSVKDNQPTVEKHLERQLLSAPLS